MGSPRAAGVENRSPFPPTGPSFDEIVARSLAFEASCSPFPTSDNRVSAIVARAGAEAASLGQDREAAEACARRQVEEDAAGTRVLVHRRVWELLGEFLAWKAKWGTAEERAVYQNMDRPGLVRRLITRRPLTFMTGRDTTKLRNGVRFSPGTSVWDSVGASTGLAPEGSSTALAPHQGASLPTPAAAAAAAVPTATKGRRRRRGAAARAGKAAAAAARSKRNAAAECCLSLAEYLSYDEMQVSALLGSSTPTFFINSGARHNCACPGPWGTFAPHGVYLGLVGARFQRPGRMEDEWIVARKNEDALKLPLRRGEPPEAAAERARMWMRGFGVPEEYWQRTMEPLIERMTDTGVAEEDIPEHMVPLKEGELFNVALYKARMRLSAETALMEADARAQARGLKAYFHVVGLGLGVWQAHQQQAQWFTEAFAEALDAISLPFVHTVYFSWISGASSCGRFPGGSVTDCANGNRIRIMFSERDPAAPLGHDESGQDLLLVAMYAWDGNSFPGNEYWLGKLCSSGDSAAACCSTIGELQNPFINDFTRNIAVLECNVDGHYKVVSK